jgi:hypothetical protein
MRDECAFGESYVVKRPFGDGDLPSAVIKGSALAERLGNNLAHGTLSASEQVLTWIGVFSRLRAICDQQLGRVQAADVFAAIEAAVRQERGKIPAARRQRFRKPPLLN